MIPPVYSNGLGPAGVEVADLVRRTGGVNRGELSARIAELEAKDEPRDTPIMPPLDPNSPDFSTKRLPFSSIAYEPAHCPSCDRGKAPSGRLPSDR